MAKKGVRRVYVGRRKRSYSRRNKKIAVAPIIGAAMSIMNAHAFLKSDKAAGVEASRSLIRTFTGYDTATKLWDTSIPMATVAPIMGGIVIHKLAGQFGVNQAMSGIPLIKL